MNIACLLAFFTPFVAWVDSFSWDIVVSEVTRLHFYYNGTLTHTEDIPSAAQIYAITYDPVQYRILFSDNHNADHRISSFDLTTRNTEPLVMGKPGDYMFVGYDPFTQLVFWLHAYNSIYSYSLNPASKAVDRYLIVKLDHYSWDIAVDSCGGYIYWMTDTDIERIRFDGSERELVLDSVAWSRLSLVIDQQTQKMYWIERKQIDHHQISIESADLNGKNRRTLFTANNKTKAGSLTVSNDFIYWHDINLKVIWQLPKHGNLEAKLFSNITNMDWDFQVIAANYTVEEQLKGNQNCETLKSLVPNELEPDCQDVLCVHGRKGNGESNCTGRCDISLCHNYCLQGNCSLSANGQPICSCNAGYSGERCQVNTCHGYCLNSGICTLNEDHNPVCQCTEGYDGERCAVPAVVIKCIETVSMLKYLLKADIPPVSRSKGMQLTCASTVV